MIVHLHGPSRAFQNDCFRYDSFRADRFEASTNWMVPHALHSQFVNSLVSADVADGNAHVMELLKRRAGLTAAVRIQSRLRRWRQCLRALSRPESRLVALLCSFQFDSTVFHILTCSTL